ncbi:hypothetical protein DPMN_110755 [Dreissena polymorpha]|uniref:Uncharacterized protein n=1 Tax=Dreissena polymorpha TaxID=45954 RepID=A0A9D4KCM7_DREPO|nr:hypothetical protein DPMN_110755 [Dreissena polymorpha]
MARQRPTRIPTPHRQCINEIDRIVIREVQYQLEVNWCRNEEIIVKGNFGWALPMWAGAPGLVMGPYIVEIDRIVISEAIFWWAWPMWAGRLRINRIVTREVQYQFEVNRLKGNFEWAWPMWAGCPRIDRIVIRKVQYQFEVNRCKNEEIIVKLQFWVGVVYVCGAPQVEIDRIVIREVRYQFEDNRCRNEEIIFQGSSAYSVRGDSGQDGQTDRQTDGRRRYPQYPHAFQKAWGQ